MHKAIFPAFILMLILASGCAKPAAPVDGPPAPPSRPGVTVGPTEPPSQAGPDSPPAVRGPEGPPPDASGEGKCGLENCHGLEITCGPDVPDFCTMEYQLGDFCRQYAVCETIGGVCQLVPNDNWDKCRVCVADCAGLGGEPAFECEAECRQMMEK